jgi:hypothetical protein
MTIEALLRAALAAARRERASEDVIVPIEKALDVIYRTSRDA